MRYSQAVSFNEELFFSGSVEIDWIYNNRDLANKASKSYVFHSNEAFTSSSDNLTDTITFTKTLFENIFGDNQENPFFTAIAGYGSGKSHLSTSIAALFANNGRFLNNEKVIKNIKQLSPEFSKYINECITKPNIVLAFNGMNDFDLTVSMSEQVTQYLKLSEVNTSLFLNFESIYTKAKKFVESNYINQNFQTELKKQIRKDRYKHIPDKLDYILNHIKDDSVFELINEISDEITGNRYKIENYLNPKMILNEICENLCGKEKPFGKVLIIFDEIGRYIEWLGSKRIHEPSIMQQLYEGIKNSNGKAALLSFIQFPLTTYFSHLNPGVFAHIARYVDRYKSARVYYLSTILESVFVNLIEISDYSEFNDYKSLHKDILRWQPELGNLIHWSDIDYYTESICTKLAAFHPLTIALLAKLSDYTQKRGPLMILRELLIKSKNYDISNVPCIYPVSIFNTEFKADILKMEESGLIKTDNVSIYDRLLSKPQINRHLKAEEKSFLQAIVIINLLELKPQSESDYFFLVQNLTGFDETLIKATIDKLEFNLGVIKYDEELFFHHIELDAVGKRDFKRFLIAKRNEIQSESDYTDANYFTRRMSENLEEQLINIRTAVSRDITTLEWIFPQYIFDINSNLVDELKQIKNRFENALLPNESKGAMIWVYINCILLPNYEKEIQNVKGIYSLLKLEKYAIQIGFLLDINSELSTAIIDYDTINNFTDSEKQKYSQFYNSDRISKKESLTSIFISIRKDSFYLLDSKVEKSNLSHKKIIDNVINNLYPKSIIFKFDGFSKTRYHNARSEYIQMVKGFSLKTVSKSELKRILADRTYNRLMGLLGQYTWNIFDGDNVVEPRHPKVKDVFNDIKSKLSQVTENNNLLLDELFNSLLHPPYGMNVYTANLILTYVLLFFRDRFTFCYENGEYDFKDWLLGVNTNDVDFNFIRKTEIKYCDPAKLKESTIGLLKSIMDSRSVIEIISKKDKVNEFVEKYSHDKIITEKIERVKEKIYNAEVLDDSYNNVIDVKLRNIAYFLQNPSEGVADILKISYEVEGNWKELYDKSRASGLDMPNQWTESYSSIFNNVEIFLDTNFEKWFLKNNWPKNHNVENFNVFCKKIAKSLYALDLKKYGKMVNDTVVRVSRTYDYLSACQKRISNYENMIIPDNYMDCKEYQTQINKFLQEISDSKYLVKSQKQYYSHQLAQVLKSIDLRIDKMEKKLADIYDEMGNKIFSNIEELIVFQTKLEALINTISETHLDYPILNETHVNVTDIISAIKSVMSMDITEKQISKEIIKLKKYFKYNIEDDPDYVSCQNLFENIKEHLIRTLNEKIKNWMSELPTGNIEKLTKTRLEQINSYISTPPVFLRDKDLIIIDSIEEKIISVLDKSVEESIIRQFKLLKDNVMKINLLKKLEKLLIRK